MDNYLIFSILGNVFLLGSLIACIVTLVKVERGKDEYQKHWERWEREYWNLRNYVQDVHGIQGIQISWLPRGKVAEDAKEDE